MQAYTYLCCTWPLLEYNLYKWSSNGMFPVWALHRTAFWMLRTDYHCHPPWLSVHAWTQLYAHYPLAIVIDMYVHIRMREFEHTVWRKASLWSAAWLSSGRRGLEVYWIWELLYWCAVALQSKWAGKFTWWIVQLGQTGGEWRCVGHVHRKWVCSFNLYSYLFLNAILEVCLYHRK